MVRADHSCPWSFHQYHRLYFYHVDGETAVSTLASGDDLNCNRWPSLELTCHSHSQTSSLISLIQDLTAWSRILPVFPFSHHVTPAEPALPCTFCLQTLSLNPVTQTLNLQNSDSACLPSSLGPVVGHPTDASLISSHSLYPGPLAVHGPVSLEPPVMGWMVSTHHHQGKNMLKPWPQCLRIWL